MSGGIAYVFDEKASFTEERCNLSMVDWNRSSSHRTSNSCTADHAHHELTGSRRASAFSIAARSPARFIKIFPHDSSACWALAAHNSLTYRRATAVPVAVEEQVHHG